LVQDDFIHLAVRTAYSLSQGAIHIKDLAKFLKNNQIPAVAITDTNNLFGALEFSVKMSEVGVQPIIGVTLGVANPMAREDRNGRLPDPDFLRLYAQNEAGYRNLLKLVSQAHLESAAEDLPHVSMQQIKAHNEGLIALSGGPMGPIGSLLRDRRADDAELLCHSLNEIFSGRFYMEIMRHGMEAEKETEAAFLDMAYKLNIPIVATNDAHFMKPDMYEAHDALLCIAAGNVVAQDDRERLTEQHYFKDPAQMKVLFSDLPEAIENTVNIAKRCAWKAEMIAPLLPNFTEGKDLSEADMLAEQARAGLDERLEEHVYTEDDDAAARADKHKTYHDRLNFELKVIEDMGFPGYFLIVADFIIWAKEHGIPVGPGRGSGAGSAVAWALKITDLDPIRFGLLFERFLNPERVSMPDFDIDFCQDKRDQVIKYVQEKYGEDRVAQIITFGTLQARAALRDVGRVMQMNYSQVDRLSKMVPNAPGSALSLKEALAAEANFRAARDSDELTAEVIKRAIALEGLYRHASTHAAGVVIGDRRLDELIPLYRDPKSDMPVSQFNMKWVESAGLVKFDFLGLKTLTVLARAVENVQESRGIRIDIDRLPLDDKKTYEMLSLGDSSGVFQLESSGMRATLKSMKPDVFEDIIALVALYRPGPMENIPTFVKRKHGEEEVVYPHELIRPLLEETYGIIVYQEQVMQIAQVLSGYTLGQADLLRRAMGKKIQEEMNKQRGIFVDGAVANGVDAKKAEEIFDLVDRFANYGFNKSHAAAYALVAYQTAYMKANYPAEFMAAIMSLDLQNTDKLAGFKKDLQQMDIPLLGPDVNASGVYFRVEDIDDEGPDGTDRAVRYALAAIKNVGEKAMRGVVEERRENGPYKDLFDFVERMDPRLVNKRSLENLVQSGALDSLHDNRAEALANVEILLRHAQTTAQEKASSQVSLFGDSPEDAGRPVLETVKPWKQSAVLSHEKAAVGFYISAHPLEAYADFLDSQKIASSAVLLSPGEFRGGTLRLAGVVDSFQKRRSQKSGKPYAFLSLSDTMGGFEMMCFSEMIDTVDALVEAGGPVVVTVNGELRDDEMRLSLNAIESLDSLAARKGGHVSLSVRSEDALEPLKELLSEAGQGRSRIQLMLSACDGRLEAQVEIPGNYRITPELKDDLSDLPSVYKVESFSA